jgi:hypothetical protein
MFYYVMTTIYRVSSVKKFYDRRRAIEYWEIFTTGDNGFATMFTNDQSVYTPHPMMEAGLTLVFVENEVEAKKYMNS